MSDLQLITYNRFEVILVTPLTDHEIGYLEMLITEDELDFHINASGRIVVIEADHIEEITGYFQEMGLIEDIGLIRHITEYEPQFEHGTKILVEFE